MEGKSLDALVMMLDVLFAEDSRRSSASLFRGRVATAEGGGDKERQKLERQCCQGNDHSQ